MYGHTKSINHKIGEGKCRRCRAFIDWRVTPMGKKYPAVPGIKRPHICEKGVRALF